MALAGKLLVKLNLPSQHLSRLRSMEQDTPKKRKPNERWTEEEKMELLRIRRENPKRSTSSIQKEFFPRRSKAAILQQLCSLMKKENATSEKSKEDCPSEESPNLYRSNRLRNKKRPNHFLNDYYSYSDWESESSHPDDPIVDIHTDSTRHRRPTKAVKESHPAVPTPSPTPRVGAQQEIVLDSSLAGSAREFEDYTIPSPRLGTAATGPESVETDAAQRVQSLPPTDSGAVSQGSGGDQQQPRQPKQQSLPARPTEEAVPQPLQTESCVDDDEDEQSYHSTKSAENPEPDVHQGHVISTDQQPADTKKPPASQLDKPLGMQEHALLSARVFEVVRAMNQDTTLAYEENNRLRARVTDLQSRATDMQEKYNLLEQEKIALNAQLSELEGIRADRDELRRVIDTAFSAFERSRKRS